MLFTAYFDEADTHGEAPTVVVGGFLGDARQWLLFNRRLRQLQRRDGFSIFHAKEFKHEEGEFEGWGTGKSMHLISDLTGLVRDTLSEGVVVGLEHARYISEYRARPWPKKWTPDSHYGVCFRACLGHLLGVLTATGKKHRLHVVVEHGPRTGNAREIFYDAKERLCRAGINLLGNFTETQKKESPELMVGDYLAHSYTMMRKSREPSVIEYLSDGPSPKRGDAGFTILEFQPGALQKLKDDFEQDRLARAEQWRKERAAKKAAEKASGVLSEE